MGLYTPAVVVAALLILGALPPLRGDDVENDLLPVVLVPGYGSSQLDALLTAAYEPPAPRCGARKGEGWFRLWPINHTAMQQHPADAPCFADQMSLVYDAVADDYGNAAGVVTRAPFFGSSRGLIGWDPLVRHLEAAGYRDGETLFGAPYDFRYSVAPRYYERLARLIGSASSRNRGRPAVLVAHSQGCALAYQFLLSRPLAWRRRFVRRAVLLSAALGGFAEGMHALAAGMDYGLPNLAREATIRLARSQQSALWRLPTPIVFGGRPLVVTPSNNNKSYSAYDIAEFLEAIGFPEGIRPYLTRVLPLWEELPPPMVPVTGMIGAGVSTPETFVYGGDGFMGRPKVFYGDGDGTINMASLVAIEKEWSGVEGQVLKVVRLPGARHGDFLTADFAVKKVVAEIHEVGRFVKLCSKAGLQKREVQ